eukprot:jgi/Hompol1/5359/HPOL_000404-RA
MNSTGNATNETETLPPSQLLPLIVSQLKHYGFYAAAKFVADATDTAPTLEPSSRLAELCALGKLSKDALGDSDGDLLNPIDSAVGAHAAAGDDQQALVIEPNTKYEPRICPDYASWFNTQHRGPCRTVGFSADGRFLATGSQDSTLKILDCQRLADVHSDSSDEVKKVVRTLYDHTDAVNDLQFHPNGLVLVSGSDDTQIKLYDMQKMHVKRAFRYLADAYPVRSLSFHPSGDFLLSGTDHHAVRIFDVHTMKCFVPSNTSDHHEAGITKVCYSPDGAIFATASLDGSIKFYDTITSRCVNTIPDAHGKKPVISIAFSKNSRYLLSMGMDSVGRLWDMLSGNVLVTYTGTTQLYQKASFVFSNNEDFVIGSDSHGGQMVFWDTRTGAMLRRFSHHSNKHLWCIAASPTDTGIALA